MKINCVIFFFLLIFLNQSFASVEVFDGLKKHTEKYTKASSLEKTVSFKIDCIQTNISGQTTITWTPFIDAFNTFVEYQVYSVQNGLLATIPSISTNTYTETGISPVNSYYIIAISGAGGIDQTYSDTISNIHLTHKFKNIIKNVVKTIVDIKIDIHDITLIIV